MDWVQWQEANSRYLSAALAWLRLRLQRLAAEAEDAPALARTESGSTLGAARSPRWSASPSTEAPEDEELARAAALMEANAAGDPPPALVILGGRLGLSSFEQNMLLLCAALELDTRVAALCSRAQDDPGRPYPTFALAFALFDDPSWDAISPERPLRYWRLLEVHQVGAQPLTMSPLRADERIVTYLKGLNYLDDRLASLLGPLDLMAGPAALATSEHAAVDRILCHLEAANEMGRPPVIQLTGSKVDSKRVISRRAAEKLGLGLLRLPAALLPPSASEVEELARLWDRESQLLPLALQVDAADEQRDAGLSALAPVRRFVTRCGGVVFLDVREALPDLGRETLTVDVAGPTPVEQQAAWADALGPGTSEIACQLAAQFNLSLSAIQRTARVAQTMVRDNGRPSGDGVWEACRVRTRPRLEGLAQRLEPRATWDDIVLPEEPIGVLRQIADQVRQRNRVYQDWGFASRMNRGLGISVLFAGESGTGKTMAAEVLANDLRLDLYRIDLSAVVSKYIGETEKNLRRLFDAAEDGGAILFFDEADALFGKRSEVKDSHDRYANIEINYLLQRMETYRGLAVLATNMKSALDQAFLRRLRFIVQFPFPGPRERLRIWQRVFPSGTPTDRLDHERLARLNLSGGGIQNVAVNASFLAAQAGSPVTMHLVFAAARTEYGKLERPVSETDFRWEEATSVVT